jgi:hypothetical protein
MALIKPAWLALAMVNGFKTGGSDDKLLKHNAILTRCIAIGNRVKGFDHNSNRGDVTLTLCRNSQWYQHGFWKHHRVNLLTIKNSVVVGTTGNLFATTTNISHYSWDSGVTAMPQTMKISPIITTK